MDALGETRLGVFGYRCEGLTLIDILAGDTLVFGDDEVGVLGCLLEPKLLSVHVSAIT